MAATNEKEADTQEVMTSRQPMRPNQLHACFSRALVVCASRQPVKHVHETSDNGDSAVLNTISKSERPGTKEIT